MIILIGILLGALALLCVAVFFALMTCVALSSERWATAFLCAWTSLLFVILALALVVV